MTRDKPEKNREARSAQYLLDETDDSGTLCDQIFDVVRRQILLPSVRDHGLPLLGHNAERIVPHNVLELLHVDIVLHLGWRLGLRLTTGRESGFVSLKQTNGR